MSLSSIIAGLAGLKTASDLTTRLREALKSREVQLDEVAARIIEIQDLISDGRAALIDAQEQIFKKNGEIATLQEELRAAKQPELIEKELRHDGRVYWRLTQSGQKGPYCPFCWDTDHKLVRLTFISEGEFSGYEGRHRRFDCIIHGQRFFLPYPGPRSVLVEDLGD